MIELNKPVRDWEKCNLCNDDCQTNIMFEDQEENSTTIKLCEDCLNELYVKLHESRLNKTYYVKGTGIGANGLKVEYYHPTNIPDLEPIGMMDERYATEKSLLDAVKKMMHRYVEERGGNL